MVKAHQKNLLRGLFQTLQEEMRVQLGIEQISHPTSKGDHCEVNWLNFFNMYLPKRYQAKKAFVIDSCGNISQQIDIVIFDQHFCPFLFNENGIYYVPAESVYGVFEVKPEINADYLKYAAEKANSVKKLKRTSVKINNAGKIQKAKHPQHIFSGILALKNGWSKNLETHLKSNLSKFGGIDFGCCIQSYAFHYTQKSGALELVMKDQLLFLFLRFLDSLQKQGTVPAMDIRKYHNF